VASELMAMERGPIMVVFKCPWNFDFTRFCRTMSSSIVDEAVEIHEPVVPQATVPVRGDAHQRVTRGSQAKTCKARKHGGAGLRHLKLTVSPDVDEGLQLTPNVLGHLYSGPMTYSIDLKNRVVSFHHTKHVMKAFADMNIIPLYLPPYTPQWQPIEYVFSTVKKSFRATAMDSIPLEDRVMGCISSKVCDIGITYRSIFRHCWKLARSNALYIEGAST
jgi:hypothetical protein